MRDVFIYRGHALDEEGRRAAAPLVVNASSDAFAGELFAGLADVVDGRAYLDRDARVEATEMARRFVSEWPSVLPAEVRFYDGLDMAEGAIMHALATFVEVLTAIRLSEAVIRREQLARVIAVDDGSPTIDAYRLVCAANGVALQLLAGTDRSCPRPLPQLASWPRLLAAATVSTVTRFADMLRPRGDAARSKILLTDYFRFQPLVQAFEGDERFRAWTIAADRRGALSALWGSRGRVQPVLVGAFLDPSRILRLRRYDRRARRFAGALGALDALRYRGYPVLEACRPWLREQVGDAFPNYAAFADMAAALLRRKRISHLIVNQDWEGHHRILALVANRANVHSICFQHGLTMRTPMPDHVSRTIATWGEREREIYRQLERPSAARIRAVGDPFVGRSRATRLDRAEACRRVGLDPSRPVALVTCERYVSYQTPDEWVMSPNERLVRILQALSSTTVQLLLRFKAGFMYDEFGDRSAVKQLIIERFNRGQIHVDPGGSLYERLAAADVVIVTCSTVGLEAMAVEKPVVLVNDRDAHDLVEYAEVGCAVRACEQDEIRAAVERCLADEPFRRRMAEAQRRYVAHNFVNADDPDPLSRLCAFLLPGDAAQRSATESPALVR